MRTASALIGLVIAFLASRFLPDLFLDDRIPYAVAEGALVREVSVAQALGFIEVGRGDDRIERQWHKQLDLEAHHCVAVVVALSGRGTLDELRFYPAEEDSALGTIASENRSKQIIQLQTCAGEEPLPMQAVAETDFFDRDDFVRTVHWVVLKAPASIVGGNAKLNRGTVPVD